MCTRHKNRTDPSNKRRRKNLVPFALSILFELRHSFVQSWKCDWNVHLNECNVFLLFGRIDYDDQSEGYNYTVKHFPTISLQKRKNEKNFLEMAGCVQISIKMLITNEEKFDSTKWGKCLCKCGLFSKQCNERERNSSNSGESMKIRRAKKRMKRKTFRTYLAVI